MVATGSVFEPSSLLVPYAFRNREPDRLQHVPTQHRPRNRTAADRPWARCHAFRAGSLSIGSCPAGWLSR
jgi:hypothetical protein